MTSASYSLQIMTPHQRASGSASHGFSSITAPRRRPLGPWLPSPWSVCLSSSCLWKPKLSAPRKLLRRYWQSWRRWEPAPTSTTSGPTDQFTAKAPTTLLSWWRLALFQMNIPNWSCTWRSWDPGRISCSDQQFLSWHSWCAMSWSSAKCTQRPPEEGDWDWRRQTTASTWGPWCPCSSLLASCISSASLPCKSCKVIVSLNCTFSIEVACNEWEGPRPVSASQSQFSSESLVIREWHVLMSLAKSLVCRQCGSRSTQESGLNWEWETGGGDIPTHLNNKTVRQMLKSHLVHGKFTHNLLLAVLLWNTVEQENKEQMQNRYDTF